MSATKFAIAFVVASVLVACAAAFTMSLTSASNAVPSANKPSLTKFHNARLKQDGRS